MSYYSCLICIYFCDLASQVNYPYNAVSAVVWTLDFKLPLNTLGFYCCLRGFRRFHLVTWKHVSRSHHEKCMEGTAPGNLAPFRRLSSQEEVLPATDLSGSTPPLSLLLRDKMNTLIVAMFFAFSFDNLAFECRSIQQTTLMTLRESFTHFTS